MWQDLERIEPLMKYIPRMNVNVLSKTALTELSNCFVIERKHVLEKGLDICLY